MMKLRDILASLAAAGLAIAPISASAGTRPADSNSSLASTLNLSLASAPMQQDDDECEDVAGEDDGCGGGMLWLLAGLPILALVALVIAGDSSEKGGSPGTGA